jgi:GNAT superfamily N-acetyltransferase
MNTAADAGHQIPKCPPGRVSLDALRGLSGEVAHAVDGSLVHHGRHTGRLPGADPDLANGKANNLWLCLTAAVLSQCPTKIGCSILLAHDGLPIMVELREVHSGDTDQISEAMLLLRPRWKNADALVEFVDTTLRWRGFRLVGVFEDGSENAISVAGFRELWSTAWGRYLYIDDVSTLAQARGKGHADLLIQWMMAEAKKLGCEAVHLDSGVDLDRAPAHRLYMRHHMRISAHHFSTDL